MSRSSVTFHGPRLGFDLQCQRDRTPDADHRLLSNSVTTQSRFGNKSIQAAGLRLQNRLPSSLQHPDVSIGQFNYNSLLSRLPQSTLQPLQRVMNAVTRVIMNLSLRDHVKPALKQLHWLPVEQRIMYKLCLFIHYIHIGLAPKYLSDCFQFLQPVADTDLGYLVNIVNMCSLTQPPAEIQSFHDAEDDALKQSKTTAAAALIK